MSKSVSPTNEETRNWVAILSVLGLVIALLALISKKVRA